jgi:hypothetical protein
MPSTPMQRATRMATAVPNGPAILETLKAERQTLIAAAEQSRPPVAAVSEILVNTHGEVVRKKLVRQFIGLSAGAILNEAGYRVAYTGVRIKGDSIFLTGSVYQRRVDDVDAPKAQDVLERLMKALTPDEATRAFRALLCRFPELLDEVDRDQSRRPSGSSKPRS